MLLMILLDILPLVPTPTPTPTPDSLSSPWQFISSQLLNNIFVVIAGVVAIVALIYVVRTYRQGVKKKELDWNSISDTLVLPNQEVRDRISIYLDGVPIQDLSLVTLQVWNAGNTAITIGDYVHPINFEFKGRVVQDAYISEAMPKSLVSPEEVKAFHDENELLRKSEPTLVRWPKLHLNARKSSGTTNTYIIKVLLTGPQGEIQVSEEIINDGVIKRGEFTDNKPSFTFLLTIIALLFFGAYFIFTVIYKNLFGNSISAFVISNIILVLIVSLTFLALFYVYIFKKY